MEKNRSITVHQRNLQPLMTEMYQNGLNPDFMRETFCEHDNQYNLMNSNDFSLPRIKIVTNGSETIRFRGPQVWATVPQFIKGFSWLFMLKCSLDIYCICYFNYYWNFVHMYIVIFSWPELAPFYSYCIH